MGVYHRPTQGYMAAHSKPGYIPPMKPPLQSPNKGYLPPAYVSTMRPHYMSPKPNGLTTLNAPSEGYTTPHAGYVSTMHPPTKGYTTVKHKHAFTTTYGTIKPSK